MTYRTCSGYGYCSKWRVGGVVLVMLQWCCSWWRCGWCRQDVVWAVSPGCRVGGVARMLCRRCRQDVVWAVSGCCVRRCRQDVVWAVAPGCRVGGVAREVVLVVSPGCRVCGVARMSCGWCRQEVMLVVSPECRVSGVARMSCRYCLGPFNYYVTLFLANFWPLSPPCHKVSHWSEPPPPVT